MSLSEQNTRINSIIARLVIQMKGDKSTQTLAQSMGVSTDGYVDFLIGIVYVASQNIFKNESQLEPKTSDELLLGFWLKEGRDIRNRLLHQIE